MNARPANRAGRSSGVSVAFVHNTLKDQAGPSAVVGACHGRARGACAAAIALQSDGERKRRDHGRHSEDRPSPARSIAVLSMARLVAPNGAATYSSSPICPSEGLITLFDRRMCGTCGSCASVMSPGGGRTRQGFAIGAFDLAELEVATRLGVPGGDLNESAGIEAVDLRHSRYGEMVISARLADDY